MEPIKTSVLILRILGWLSIVAGIIFLILTIISPVTIYFKLVFFLSQGAPGFLGGLILLCLARSLSKGERWSWYLGVAIFSLSLIFSIINIIKGQLLYFLGVIIGIILLTELIPEREIFIKQPKEKISQWFRKSCFIGIIAGIIFLCLSVGISTYLMYNWAKEAREGLEKTIEESIMREQAGGGSVEDFSTKTHVHEIKNGFEYVYGYKMDRPPAGESSSSYCPGVSIYCWSWAVYTSKEERANPKIFIYSPSPEALTVKEYSIYPFGDSPDILKIEEDMKLVKTEEEKIQDSEYYFQKLFYIPKEGVDKENMILVKWFAGSFEKSGTIAVLYKDETDKNLGILNQMLSTFRFLK